MPLPRYGVAIGTFVSFARDPQDQFGRWYHGHLAINTPSGRFESALDVDTPSGVGISYRVSPKLSSEQLGPVAGLADGWHSLAASPDTGAIDYLRSPFFRDRLLTRSFQTPAPGPLDEGRTPPWVDTTVERLLLLFGRLEASTPFRPGITRPWVKSTGDNALTTLEAELPGAKRIFIFGDRYASGDGVHDVHMNQGDPSGSQWWAQDGIWQDGAVFVQRPNETVFAWQVRFNSQAMQTDNQGHPL